MSWTLFKLGSRLALVSELDRSERGGTVGWRVLAVGASLVGLALANATGCGGDVTAIPEVDAPPSGGGGSPSTGTNQPGYPSVPTNVGVVNVAPSGNPQTNIATAVVTNIVANYPANIAVGNVPTNIAVANAPTNIAVANVPTNIAVANAPTTNVGEPVANYIDDGIIHGYCFGVFGVAGVINDCDVSRELCCGYMLPGTSWEDFALLGCNVNQPIDGGAEGLWDPAGTSGICIRGSGFERIQIQGPAGAADARDRWCASVPPGGDCVAWGDFNTTCWDNLGEYYSGEPLQMVGALQPSKSDGVDVPVTPVADGLCVAAIWVME